MKRHAEFVSYQLKENRFSETPEEIIINALMVTYKNGFNAAMQINEQNQQKSVDAFKQIIGQENMSKAYILEILERTEKQKTLDQLPQAKWKDHKDKYEDVLLFLLDNYGTYEMMVKKGIHLNVIEKYDPEMIEAINATCPKGYSAKTYIPHQEEDMSEEEFNACIDQINKR